VRETGSILPKAIDSPEAFFVSENADPKILKGF